MAKAEMATKVAIGAMIILMCNLHMAGCVRMMTHESFMCLRKSTKLLATSQRLK